MTVSPLSHETPSNSHFYRFIVPTLQRSPLYTSADKLENTVISAWMPISRPWTVTIRQCKCLIQASRQPVVSRPWIQGHLLCPTVCHPWTLDFGIHAEKTDPQHLCITMTQSEGTIQKRPGAERLPQNKTPVGFASNRGSEYFPPGLLIREIDASPFPFLPAIRSRSLSVVLG